jgi:cytochrome c556
MHAFKRAAAVLLLSLLSSAAQQSARAQDSDPQDLITYRELIMKELEAEAAALGLMVAGQIPPDNLTLQAKAAAASARSALKAFEPKVPGGEAKPEVWANWADFAKRMQSLAQGAEEMAKASEGNNLQAVSGLIVTALPCKECHDTYRNKKK